MLYKISQKIIAYVCIYIHMRIAPKIMSPFFFFLMFIMFICTIKGGWCWCSGRILAFSPTFYCILLTYDNSGGAAWQTGICRGSAWSTNIWSTDIHVQHMETWHMFNIHGEQTVDVNIVKQWWQQHERQGMFLRAT